MKRIINSVLVFAFLTFIFGCKESNKKSEFKDNSYPSIGTIEFLAPEANSLIASDAKIEILDSGFTWVEGPLWLESDSILLFSDVSQNKIYQWSEGQKSKVYLNSSGLSEGNKYEGSEPGSNGLILNNDGKLVLTQHGNRQLAIMDASIKKPESKYITLVNNFNGKKLNSPNDLIQDKKGNYYFTDPIFGLSSAEKPDLQHQGVYKLTKENELILLDTLEGPNGLALTNDGKFLLVANTSQSKAILYELELDENSNGVKNIREAYNFSSEVESDEDVLDGLTIDKKGNIYISGPKGLWILNKEYKPIIRLMVPNAISNCTLSDDEKTLYITNTDKILRLKLI